MPIPTPPQDPRCEDGEVGTGSSCGEGAPSRLSVQLIRIHLMIGGASRIKVETWPEECRWE